MKTSHYPGVAILAALTVAQVAGAATTSFTATGWIIDVPVPGIRCTNGLGQIGLRGNAHTVRMECPTEPLMTGRRLVFMDSAGQADGSYILAGTAYQEVGTWDGTGTNFTASGGLWDATYRGTMGADGSLSIHVVGRGWGGVIDGLYLDETLTREAGEMLDPALPCHSTGTLKPPPVNTHLVLDDGSNPPAAPYAYYGPPGSYSWTRLNGQIVVNGYWPGVVTRSLTDSYTFGMVTIPPWSVEDGQTLETRVDLVNLNEGVTDATLLMGTPSGIYSMHKGPGYVWIQKWSPNLPWGPAILFSFEKVQIPKTNVTLCLALTRTNTDVVVTARVLDRGNPAIVLHEHSVVDTPGQDPALTSAELLDLSGMDLALHPDLTEPPFTTARAGIGMVQYNFDGQQPPAVATFDNFELWKYEVPPLGIERAVALTWPDVGNYSLEWASTPQGPFLPLNDPVPPGMRQIAIPVNSPEGFFRLRPAP